MNMHSDQKGFSLIELLVAIALIGTLAAVGYGILGGSVETVSASSALN